MAVINQNKLAKSISEAEGKREEVNIAQIKEIMKITLEHLADEWNNGNESGVISLIKKHGC